jgi:hypothetical protein
VEISSAEQRAEKESPIYQREEIRTKAKADVRFADSARQAQGDPRKALFPERREKQTRFPRVVPNELKITSVQSPHRLADSAFDFQGWGR